MVARQNIPGDTGPLDFFISYSPADERWASWIAWTLEEAGFRTVLQAWDFVPGTNFVDFMDRGVSESAAVIAVLSRNYERSRYGRMEWQAALRADPDAPERRLITVRVEDIPVEGLLATITYVDLVPVTDPAAARDLLLARVRQALDGRARPSLAPGYPGAGGLPVPSAPSVPSPGRPLGGTGWAGRRRPAAPPSYPRMSGVVREREAVTVLQLAGPAFGRGQDPAELQAAIWGDLVELADAGAPSPDLLVVTGDLTASGSRREFEQALAFLTGLRALLGLEPHRVALVPGGQDVNQAACQAYFSTCEADEMPPRPPYWPKWRHFAGLFRELYQGLDVVFDSDQPWTLFPVPELHTVVAGLNSSMAYSHRRDDQYGLVGREQAAWFAQALRPHETEGWLRIGAVRHAPGSGRSAAPGVRRTAVLDGAGPLHDTDVLTRLTAPRLHLLLHGPTGPGALPALATGSGEVPVIGAVRPGGHQLVRVGRDGVAVWHGPGEPRRRAVQWRRADRAFGPEAAIADDQDGGPAPDPEPRAVQTPAEILLARVAEVCRTRHEGAQIRPVDGPVPQLLVTWTQSGFVRQQRVAVHTGTPTAQDVDRFVALVHAADSEAEAELVHDGPPPDRELRDAARRRGVRVRSFTEFQGLLDLRGYVAGQSERLRTDPRYPPGMYLPQRYREVERLDAEDRDGLVDEMLRLLDSDQGRFLLLLGDFGHGKTFALRELARRIPGELPHLVPLLIELHALDRAYSFEGLVAAHLAAHGVDNIDLRAFRYMLQQGRIVLLFDGFDELVNQVTYDRAAERLQVLLDSAVDHAKIVVSSRTQHFRSQGQVLTALGERVGLLPHRRVLAVQEFSPQQIRAYLVNRYDGDERAADHRLGLLDAIPDLLALCRNPRLLGFVADLDDDRLRAVAGAGRALSPAGLYEEVLTAWLGFEALRGSGSPGRAPGLSLDQLWDAVTALALRLWESGQDSLRLDELTDVAETLTGLADARLSVPQTAHAIGSGSLLVRSDDGVFRFIHGSVVEWLVARECGRRLTDGDSTLLGRRPLSQLAVEFLCDLADHRICQAWAERELAGTGGEAAADAAHVNAVKILSRLRVPARTDLRGAALAGEDLSHRDFSGVDLTRADLTDARLVGANLSGAVLRGARLTGARLDGADLTGADLRGADLRRARLIGTELTGARLEGGRWRRAALISATTGALADSPELATAAIAPGMAVDSGFRPSTVGVPYGYEARIRLPEPISYSPDGELLAVGSEDGGVLVCDAATGIPLRTLQGHTGRVYAVKFRSRVLATGSADGTVRLWDPVSGRCLHRLEIHPSGVWPVVLDTEGARVATGDADGQVTVWDTESGTPLQRLPGHSAPVYTVALAPGDTTLVTGDASTTVRLWDLTTGQRTGELTGHQGAVYRARFSPDGTLLATADRGDERHGGTVRVWDFATRRLLHEFTGHSGRVYTLDFHPGGTLLVSGDTEGEVRLWDLDAGRSAGLLGGCRGAVYQVLFDPDGTLLAAGDSAGVVRLWRIGPEADPVAVPLNRQPSEHRGSVWVVKFRPPGDTPAQAPGALLVTGGNDGVVRLWEPATGQGRRILRGHGRRIGTLSFSADGALLAAGGNDGVVRVWHSGSGRRLRELTGQSDRLVSAAFGPTGSLLATASSDGDIYLWNAASGEYQRELDVETDHVWAEAFSADGELLATANDDDTVRLWYRATGAHVATITEHYGRVRAIAFRADDAVLATGCDDKKVRLWDLTEHRITSVLDGHADRVYAVAFGPDGSWLASASWDGTAVIWRDGEIDHRLSGHTGKLWTAAAHPRRPLLATAGDDRTVRLWDPDTGEETAVLTGHTGRILAVAFSPDGSLLASGGEDGTVRLWHVPADAPATLRATLVGMPGGWAALSPSGGYKYEGDVTGEFWHAVGMCRFEPGELDGHLPGVRHVALDDPLD
ncbi:TIR domain-containing protein [Streptomyces sp. NPDC048191]|uniref:WD40 domain-containing protein n=1 Tax=Streptomyces sp. NPDC048191 TaxID=3155484 RepID=UPI0033C0E0EB